MKKQLLLLNFVLVYLFGFYTGANSLINKKISYTDEQLCLFRRLSSVYVLKANLNYEMIRYLVKTSHLASLQSMK